MTQVNLKAVEHFGRCQAHVYAALISLRNSPDEVSRVERAGSENDLNRAIDSLSKTIKGEIQAAILAASKGAQTHEHINVPILLRSLADLYKSFLDSALQDALKSKDVEALAAGAKSTLDLTGGTLKSAGEDYAAQIR